MSVMTSQQLTEKYWPDLEDWQHTANTAFIEILWEGLVFGGTWFCPVAQTAFTKVEGGWEDE